MNNLSSIEKIVKSGSETGKQLEFFSKFARDYMQTHLCFDPMLHCLTEEDKVEVILCPWENDMEKAKFFNQTGPMLLAANGTKAFIFGSEVWVKRLKKGDPEPIGPLAKELDVQEALIASYVTDNYCLTSIMPVTRIKNEKGETIKVEVEEAEWKDMETDGRVVHMFKQARKLDPVLAKALLKVTTGGDNHSKFTKEERDSLVSYVSLRAKEGVIPTDLADQLENLNKKMNQLN